MFPEGCDDFDFDVKFSNFFEILKLKVKVSLNSGSIYNLLFSNKGVFLIGCHVNPPTADIAPSTKSSRLFLVLKYRSNIQS